MMKRIVLNTTSSGLEEMNVPHEVEFIRFNIHINNSIMYILLMG